MVIPSRKGSVFEALRWRRTMVLSPDLVTWISCLHRLIWGLNLAVEVYSLHLRNAKNARVKVQAIMMSI
jgi:hypothetical protein